MPRSAKSPKPIPPVLPIAVIDACDEALERILTVADLLGALCRDNELRNLREETISQAGRWITGEVCRIHHLLHPQEK
jgi:hypothetical protein